MRILGSMAAMAMMFVLMGAAVVQADWSGLAGPEGGTVDKLFVDADGTVYAVTPLAGVYSSSDNGASWTLTTFTGGSEPVLSQSPSGLMFMATNFDEVVYSSDDHFATMTSYANPQVGNLESVHAISDDILLVAGRITGALEIYQSSDAGASWASVYNAGFQGSGPMYAACNGGLLMAFETIAPPQFSADDGATWTEVTNPGGGIGASSLLGTADGNALIGRGNDIFRSTDGGSSWTEVLGDMNITADKLSQAPDGTIYAGSTFNQFYMSSDDGQTWTEINHSLADTEVAYTFAALSGSVLMGASHGVWESTDGGVAWAPTNSGLVATRPPFVIATSNGRVAAGDYAVSGLSVMESNGTWNLHADKGPAVAMNENGDAYCSLGQTLWRSTDGMESWTEGALPGDAPAYNVLDSPGSTIFALASYSALFRSTDNGGTWTELSPVGVKDMAYGSDGTLYIVTAFNGSQFSTDNGDTWTTTDGAAPLVGVEIGPDDTLYRFNGQAAQRSADGGSSWTNIHEAAIPDTVQFPGFTINHLGVDADGVIYMDMDWYSNWPVQVRGGGVYSSADQGATWDHHDAWRSNAFNMGQDGYFYAGSSNGVYRIMSGAEVRDAAAWEPLSYALAQNYPNPFNPTTEIRFTLTAPGHTELQVFDITGRLVETLTAGQLGAGSHVVSFDGSHLASGTYFYQLSHPDGVQSRRMTLVK